MRWYILILYFLICIVFISITFNVYCYYYNDIFFLIIIMIVIK